MLSRHKIQICTFYHLLDVLVSHRVTIFLLIVRCIVAVNR